MSKTFRILSLLAVVFSMALASCTKEVTLTLSANDPNLGTVAGAGTYAYGTEVTIMATPAQGYYFNGWSDNNAENPRTIKLTKNMSLIATFSDDPNGGTGGGSGTGDPQELSGSMSANRTLKDLGLPIDYIIDGTFYVEGNACLTIEPGVCIAFTSVTGGIYVGENAGLKMVGTPEKHIVFRGPVNNVNVGSWNCIQYTSTRPDNQMEYVDLINGGSDENGSVLNINGGKVSVKHCTIDGSLNDGIGTQYGAGLYAFENSTIKNCARYPFYLNNASLYSVLGEGNVYQNNGMNYLACWGDIEEDMDITMHKQAVPYHLLGANFWIYGKLSIDAGVQFVVNEEYSVFCGQKSRLQINGTEAEPVNFQCLVHEAGAWKGFRVESSRTSQGGTYMHYTNISDCGYDEAACIEMGYDGKLSVDHINLNGSAYGISMNLSGDWVDDEYVYDWSSSPVRGTNITYNCALGNVLVGDQVFDGSLIPAAKKGIRR